MTAGGAGVRFTPNRLERRRADTYWGCTTEDVTGVRARGKLWLVIETAAGAETFRVFGAKAAVPRFEEALHPAVKVTFGDPKMTRSYTQP